MKKRDQLTQMLRDTPHTVAVLLTDAGWISYRSPSHSAWATRQNWWAAPSTNHELLNMMSVSNWLTTRQAFFRHMGLKP